MLKPTLPIMLLGLALSWTVDAAPRSYGPVKDQDTLWTIADRLRPDNSATVQQTMLALYYKNPQAFASNNINSLMKGAVLKAPSSAEARRYQRLSALREARKHNHFWKRGVDLPRSEPPPVPKLKERTATKRAKPTVIKATTKPVAYAATPRNTTRRLARLQAQLQVAEAKNQELTNELNALQAKQSKGKPNPQLDAQVKKLKLELQELTGVLDQKDNHIKTLQASLKNASETIKAQHADNIRLYDKLKEVSPASVPKPSSSEGKSELKLTTVEASTAAVAGAAKAAAEETKESTKTAETTSNAPEAVTKTESPNTSTNTPASATENKNSATKSVWADETKASSTLATTEAKPAATNAETKPSSATTGDQNANANKIADPNSTPKVSTEPQTLAAAIPNTAPTAKPENSAEKPASETAKPSTETPKATTTPSEAAKTEATKSSETPKPESKAAIDSAKPSEPTEKTVKPEEKPAESKTLEATKPNDAASKTAEAKGNTDTGTGGTASKSPATSSSETASAIKAPSNAQTAANLEPTNDVKTSSSVPVSQMLTQAGNQASTGNNSNSSVPLRGVSPLALAVALISLLFILAMVWRAFVQQREMRRLEEEEARIAERMRKRLADNQSAVVSTATLVEKKDPELDPNPEIKF